jgi:guanylate kinase
LSDTIAAHLPTIKLVDRQGLLEMADAKGRLQRLFELMQGEIEILQLERKIRSRVKKQMEKTQKEYYLNEQMQAIQKELGGGERDEFKNELQEIEERLAEKKMSEEARTKVEREIKKLKMMHPTSAEATVVRNYVDWVLALPWFEKTEERQDIEEAIKILDQDHHGLKKCKERIIEYLAVQALTKKLKGPILCFVGPPGVGKTSITRSIARATGRKFVRISLGGVRDEAESQAVCRVVEEELLTRDFSLALDCHSGFGVNDRIWFPYAHTSTPIQHLAEIYALKNIFEGTYRSHRYLFEPQSRQYLAHGDLWDHLYLQACARPERIFLPLTLEMGSWLWVKKNPRQLFSRHGIFNPLIEHRDYRRR